jgi:AraC-like DNA-binding protein
MHRPYVDLYVSEGESGIQCTFLNTRTYTAAGTGRIVGARFRPGSFHAFWDKPLSELKDKIIDIQQVFPVVDDRYIQQLLSLDDQAAVHMLSGTVLDKIPRPDPNIDLINEIIHTIEDDRDLQTVKAVARQFHRSERWIQQHFITDFKRVLGRTPLQYKKELALQ